MWLLHTAGRANAAEVVPRRAALVLEADASCARAEVLRARVRSEGWRWVDATDGRPDLSLAATVSAAGKSDPTQVVGRELLVTLQLRWRDGRRAERSFAADSCEAALDALALLIQMTLDAENGAHASSAAQSDDAVRRSRADPSDAAGRGHAAPDAAGPEGESETLSDAVTQLVVGASVAVSSAAAPELQPGLAAYLALELPAFGVVRPRLQLELSHAWRSGIAVAGGSADFSLDGGQLLACPVALAGSVLAAHGCGAFELARLGARGHDVYEPRAQARAWASAGLAILLHLRPVSKLELQLGAALLRPLWRDQFSFAPDVFYVVPAWRWQIKLGVAVCFL